MSSSSGQPTPAGYSRRPLVQKLGVRAGDRVCLLEVPDHYHALVGPLPEGVRVSATLRGPKDFIHAFFTGAKRLRSRLPALAKALEPRGMLWLSWPKKSSGLETDLDGNLVRQLGLAAGLVDVKVCAVDETWSGLKFVVRVRDRPGG